MKYPETSHKPVTDEYHGIPVEDPYRWLEDAKDPSVRVWTEAQNKLVREALDAVPQRPAFYEQFKKLYGEASPEYNSLQVRPGRTFASPTSSCTVPAGTDPVTTHTIEV